MKFSINYDKDLEKDEIIINHNADQEVIDKLYLVLSNYHKENTSLSFFKNEKQYFIVANEILFFESLENKIFAHAKDTFYESKLKLYELEEILPDSFLRISKSTICNVNEIYAINKNITSDGLIKFRNSKKEVYVSRKYYPILKSKLESR